MGALTLTLTLTLTLALALTLTLLQQQAGELLDVRARALEGGVEAREVGQVLPPVGELLLRVRARVGVRARVRVRVRVACWSRASQG